MKLIQSEETEATAEATAEARPEASANAAPEAPTARRLETRTRLLDAATEVFAEEGVQAASVEHVCARAGFSRGAFYSNFSTKEELFLAVLEREFDRRARETEELIAELRPALQELQGRIAPEQAAQYITRFIAPKESDRGWAMLETEFTLLAMRDPEIAPGYVWLVERSMSNYAALIESAVTAAGRRFTLPVDRATELIAGMCERAIRGAALDAGGTGEGGAVDALPHRIGELLLALTIPSGTD
ncbi:TetR/AcrR family transcriptional regulator [Leucobacter sp. USHLN153]|uniref:TetR/AcrR family transcriptional regulator n=1 Tax=Leucobacter sp. USHLN153 TaxID=3081268 RepID=UPI003017CB91